MQQRNASYLLLQLHQAHNSLIGENVENILFNQQENFQS